jgi:hypothetical protein
LRKRIVHAEDGGGGRGLCVFTHGALEGGYTELVGLKIKKRIKFSPGAITVWRGGVVVEKIALGSTYTRARQ